MKKSVYLSVYSFVVSVLSFAVLTLLAVYLNSLDAPLWLVMMPLSVIVTVSCLTLCYMPLSISVDDEALSVHRSLMVKTIPLSDVESAELCPPTVVKQSLTANSGWFGYWGRCTDSPVGRYFAYYGKASNCFLVKLRDGRQYMLGCKDPQQVVDYIKARIK